MTVNGSADISRAFVALSKPSALAAALGVTAAALLVPSIPLTRDKGPTMTVECVPQSR